MMRRGKEIQYNPALSVKDNAKKNGVSDATIRYYIKTNLVDRRFDRKQNIIDDCRKYLKKHPKATRNELQQKTGHSLSTIRKYWKFISTEQELTDFDNEKAKKRQLRQYNNFYATHPSVTQDILRQEQFYSKILEPFCGTGTMAEVIRQNGYEVEAYDILDRGYGGICDFMSLSVQKGEQDIITNPPYDERLNDYILKCLNVANTKVALLLPLNYLSGEHRAQDIFLRFPPSRVYVYTGRILVGKNGDFSQVLGNKVNYSWYIWEKGYKGVTELRWLKNGKVESEQTEEKPKVQEVTILEGIPFKPYEEFHIPVSNCIQFHSKALPENRVLSNHYDCIITFRGVEFYSLEQLFMGLTYSDSPDVLKRIMAATSGIAAKKICREKYSDKRDWDFEEKRYRIIALCHLFKYLSVKEYRDRLRETYPQTLVECPNGQDYHFGMVQNLETNVFEGNNCSGRTTMIVRDMMKEKEDAEIAHNEALMGHEFSEEEKEEVREALYGDIRYEFEHNEQVLKDSKPLFTFIEKTQVPRIKKRRPKPLKVPDIDRDTKCLVMDFDDTVFDTSADDAYRKCEGKKDMDKAFEMIPQYRLYDGWQEVFDWTKKHGVKVAVLSAASGKLIEAAFRHFRLPCDAVIGYQPYLEKPNPILGNMLMERLNIRESQIIHVGNSDKDDKQARGSQFRFIGATWHTNHKDYFREKGVQTISNPRELIPIMEEAGWASPVRKRRERKLKKEEAADAITEIRYRDTPAGRRRSKYYGVVRCTDDYAYFYQGVPFSNWWTSPAIEYDGHTFSSSESVFMYKKAKQFGDDETAEKIAKSSYSKAKSLGKEVKNFHYTVWCAVREDAMYTALQQKLKYDAEFREALLSDTYKGKTWVEASKKDNIWGIGTEASDKVLKQGESAWNGQNLLGKTLTRLRDDVLAGRTVVEPVTEHVSKEEPVKKRTRRVTKTSTEKATKPIKQEYPLEGKMYHSILGAMIGDISGSSREGHSQSTFKTDFKFFTANSNLTDDTVLTVAIADWLNHKDTLTVKEALLKWGRMFPNAGYGSGFKSFIKGDLTFVNFSTANGAAMRVSPVAIKAQSLDEALELAKQSAKPTHSGGGVKGAQAIAAAVYLAKDGVLKGKSVDEIKAEIKSTIEKRYKYNLDMSIEDIRERTQRYGEMKERMKRTGIPSLGYTRMSDAALSCPMAIIAVLQANSFEDAVRLAISMGGDSDTEGAMAGSIAAQLWGIPEALAKKTLVYLPSEMIDVVNEFEGTDFKPTGIAPPRAHHWTNDDYVVYGDAPTGQKGEDGKTETIPSRFNNKPVKGYPIPTIGKSLDEIKQGVDVFIQQAKEHPERRYHVRKVGYHKAGYTVQQIAPLFKEAVELKNVLLPEEMLNELNLKEG